MATEPVFHCQNTECGGIWSADQIIVERFGEAEIRLCPRCRLGVEELKPPVHFWERVPDAFLFPFRGNGKWILVAGTPFLAFLDHGRAFTFLLWALITVLMVGYFGALLLQITQATATDPKRELDWPDIANLGELCVITLQILGSALVVFGPALVCFVYGFSEAAAGADASINPVILWTAAGFLSLAGVVYYPMAFLALALFDTIQAINPARVLPAILKAPAQYAVVLTLLILLWLARLGLALVVAALPLGARVVMLLPAEFVLLYTLVVSARLLGLLYLSNEENFGWFR